MKRRNPNQGGLWDHVPPRDPRELREKFPNMRVWHPKYGFGPHEFKKPGDRYKIELVQGEIDLGDYRGNKMADKGQDNGYENTLKGQSPASIRREHIFGERNELRVARCYNFALALDWLDRFTPHPDFGPFNGPGIAVRASGCENASIIVRPRDDPRHVFLLVCEESPKVGYLHAWCWGYDAKKYVPLTDPPVRNDKGELVKYNKPAHFVHMNAIADDGRRIVHFLRSDPEEDDPIPQWILDSIPKGYRWK